jgi:hypothetical protein
MLAERLGKRTPTCRSARLVGRSIPLLVRIVLSAKTTGELPCDLTACNRSILTNTLIPTDSSFQRTVKLGLP